MNKITLITGCIFMSLTLNAQKSETNTKEIIEFPPPIVADPDIDTLMPFRNNTPFAPPDDSDLIRDADEPYTFVDEEAEYPGGFAQLMQFISENYNYPDVAQKNHIEGKLYVRFVVNEDGTVSDVSLDQKMVPSCPECDTEAIRVIRKLNGWTPGKIAGKPVRQWYIIPISLSL